MNWKGFISVMKEIYHQKSSQFQGRERSSGSPWQRSSSSTVSIAADLAFIYIKRTRKRKFLLIFAALNVKAHWNLGILSKSDVPSLSLVLVRWKWWSVNSMWGQNSFSWSGNFTISFSVGKCCFHSWREWLVYILRANKPWSPFGEALSTNNIILYFKGPFTPSVRGNFENFFQSGKTGKNFKSGKFSNSGWIDKK